MTTRPLIGTAFAVAILGLSLAAVQCASGETVTLDFTSHVDTARKQPAETSFEVRDVAIESESKRSVIARGQTRLTYHVTVPDRSTFRVAVALSPEAWMPLGDGVLCFIGISDGRSYRQKYEAEIRPPSGTEDRRWQEVAIDLREYAGLTVDIILNTRAGVSPDATVENDAIAWGAPRVVTRR